MSRAKIDPQESLSERIKNAMMDSMEVIPFTEFVGDVIEIERETGHRFTDNEIRRIWLDSADYNIDAWIQNEHDTPDSDRDPRSRTREESIAYWEAMRPTSLRIKYLRETFVDLR